MNTQQEIKITRIGLESEAIVQRIFEASPTYFRRVDGDEVQSHFARREITDRAKKTVPSYEKIFCLITLRNIPIGVVDLHKNHPEEGTVYLGLLLLNENFHGRGLGRLAYETAEKFAASHLGANRMSLGVSDRNAVADFWLKMGFKPNGKTYTWKGEKVESLVSEMDKDIKQNGIP